MTKLALVLGGHASLGAYTAGAVTEILTAVEDNRRRERVPVSVVAGSGAGALCAALAARSLVVNVHLVPWIERVWVDALDARHLLDPDRRDRSTLLDPEPLEELTLHTVAGPPASDDRPSTGLGEDLRLGLDLVPVGGAGDPRQTPGPATPGAVFELGRTNRGGDPVWGEVRRAALAAWSVPVALPLRRLDADVVDLPGAAGPDEGPPYAGSGPSRPRPLALARRLMRRQDGPADGEWRVLVVDPEPGDGAREPTGSPFAAAGLLVRAGLGADIARDWREAEDAAERTELLRALVGRLPEIHGRMDDPDAVGLGRRIGELAERVAERDVRRFGPDGGNRAGDPVLRRLDENLRRIRAHPAYEAVFRDLESRAGRTRVAKLIYVLEALGDLQGSDPARLHHVAPDAPRSLAGRGLAGYGGFAARAWRRHDLVAGRRDARRVLEESLSDVIAYEPDGPDAYDPPPVAGLDSAVDRRTRRRLRSRLEAEVDRLLAQASPRGIGGLLYRLARPGIRREAAGRIMDALEEGAVR